MKSKLPKTVLVAILFLISTAAAQSGGTFEITQSVVAGGGQSSAGGAFSLDGSIAQPLAGNGLSNLPFSVTSGFWHFSALAPTAASVTVGGRVLTAQGSGIRNVLITMIGANGAIRTARSTSFGFYHFTGVPAGEIYIITAQSRRFSFFEPTRVVSVLEDITDLDFIAGTENSQ